MLIFKSIVFLLVITRSILAANYSVQFRELILRIYEKSDAATVYFIGIDEEFLIDFMKTQNSIPVSIFSSDSPSIYGRCTNIVIVFQVPDNDHNRSKTLENIIQNLQVRKFVIISARPLASLHQYFSFFAEKKFTRIFGIIANTSSYAYLPFAENPVQELAENGHLPDALKDLNGFAFRTTVLSDEPRTFWYPHKSGQNRIGGRVGQIFLQFLRRHNATFREILMKKSKQFVMDVVINATIHDEIDISMNAYLPQKTLDISYPITVEENVIMVPCNGYLDPIEYFQRPFQATVWMWIGLTAIYMIISQVILNSLAKSKLDIWGSFSEIYLTLLSSSSGQPIISNYRFHLQVIVFGFIFERLYGSYFQSFLTAYIKIKQFDTIQDLVDNNVPLMISTYKWDLMKSEFYLKGFDKIAVPTNTLEYVRQLLAMKNTSFAYVLDADRCQFLIGFQSLFIKSLFRMARETISSYHIGYLLAFHSPFKAILNDFIIEIRQTGLIQKWDADVIYQAKARGFRMDVDKDDFRNIEDLHKPLTLHHLTFAWRSLAIGLTISSVIFVIELVLTIVKTYNNNTIC